MNLQQAMAAWAADRPHHEARGLILPGVVSYVPDGFAHNFALAMDQAPKLLGLDAQPALSTDPNSAVPAMLTTMISPEIIRVLFSPNEAANIFGERKQGTWLDDTAMFPIVEHTGEVSSYGDNSENGSTGANTNWPQRQAYLFQTIKQYGERELERAGLARINWVSEIDEAAVDILNKFANLTYFFGVAGLQNYGLLNDPNLNASITPAVKAYGGTKWIVGTEVKATANEIYTDIQSVYLQMVTQGGGLINQKIPMVLAMAPGSEVALTTTNAFGVNVTDLLKKNFPNLEVKTAVQYGALSAANPQGVAGGNFMQLIAGKVGGQNTGFMAFNEKMRAHPIIRQLSSFRQKVTGGTWGAVIRQSFAISSMIGI